MSVRDVRIGEDGIRLRCDTDVILDALFDGRRIWSFRPQRDGEPDGDGWLVGWPHTLRGFLAGHTELTLVEHGGDAEPAFRDEVQLGSADRRIAIVNAEGKPLALDKDLRRVLTFDSRTREHVEPLLDAIDRVLGALREVGLDAFLAYGTLLGAVREGKLIAHDSDTDLGYVSRHEDPTDVVRESFAVQRHLSRQGFTIVRYSGAAIKVAVMESDGNLRGLDVFGGFLRDGHLHLMGEIRTPYEREWITPLGTATLEGRQFPVPADTDRFLTATYGPSWRTPDPAFHFETPRSTSRRLSGWFRGIFVGRPTWDRAYSVPRYGRGKGPSETAQWVAQREPHARAFIDIGCGRGRDVAFMARRGVRSLGLDLHPRAFDFVASRWDPAEAAFWNFNILEQRHVAVAVARAARLSGPTVVLARHLADTLEGPGRRQLWRTARAMLGGPDQRLYVEFLTEAGADGFARRLHVEPLDPATVRGELEATGATVVHQEQMRVSDAPDASRTCRVVAEWSG